MPLVKILAPLTGGARDATVLASAFAAAKPFNAHVVALFIRPDPTEAMPFFGEGVSGVVVQEIVDVAKEAADKAADGARAALAIVAGEAGVTVIDKIEKRDVTTVSFHDAQGNFADQVAQRSRLSDLIVFGPLKEGDNPGIVEAFEAVLLETGRPVLLTAKIPSMDFARRIAVGWDGSTTSSHALTASLPYLTKAESVEILSVKRGNEEPKPCDEACEYLKLQGLAVSVRAIDAGQKPVGEVLLEAAVKGGAGMLVLGGYGHSRLREFFVGGVTKHVVSRGEIPLFLVH
jgi:nucleotide-binding universal stress UspA family protein